ncbi:hypothetical protein HER10_EVM0013458 [Colletotrichum scovillei]|uniref:uncharacterized protein n=1 Tax=Colletotrichum scovillei TaxID=1209932 RepID=UPI0015C3F524|nr:uncharacterized protein HER10_EVM0013458 [Colletotrichum scovillei]KAF4778985.1 hypothetical protein HER10_EVM0013458 [Colletotrichum scovillei]
MATKHYFPDTAANTLVPRALRALVLANPHLTLSEAERVVANSHNDRSTVSIIGGGGSGHEPAWILEAMRLAPSDAGTILLITNYTGDRLHFGLAAERAKASGLSEKVVVLPATDDVSIGRSKSSRVGRRGMPGHIFTMKILGAAAAEKYRFDQCVEIGRAVNDQTVSIGSALDHCHVPGRQYHSVAEDVCVVGAGIHNEPGQQLITPFPSVNDLIDRMLKLLCDQNDAERAFVSFEKGDEITLLINNYGGLSVLELGALTDEVQTQLASTWSITPVRTQVGTFETSLNAPGFSISLCNISAAARQLKSTAAELLQLLDRPTSAVYWPNTVRPVIGEVKANGLTTDKASATNSHEQKSDLSKVDPKLLENAIRSACERAIAAEPNLTKWDMVMGDGDCGEAVKGLCESLLRNLDNGSAASGSVFAFLESTVEAVDDMGGTLGAILGILLSAFTSSLRSEAQANPASTRSFSPMLYASSLASAVESLKSHTPAREGDRTVMDVLIPFSDAFVKSGDFGAAVKVAAEKAEATRYLKARFGRATYVGDAAGQELPDPGAWALYEFLLGMTEA